MFTIQQAIYAKLIGDSADHNGSCLQTLLGGSGRIFAGLDYTLPEAPGIVFNNLANTQGNIQGDNVTTDVEYWTIKVFADNCMLIIRRIRQLLDHTTFTETTEAGVLRCVWDSDGPDFFDEDLRVRRKDVRFKVYASPKGVGPV